MKSYRLYLCDPDPKFLQRSSSADSLKATKNALNSWIRQMGHQVPSRGAELMILDEKDQKVATAGFGSARIRWTTLIANEESEPKRPSLLDAITGDSVP